MNLPAILSFVPKVAIFLLLVVGGFIVYELSSLFKDTLPKKNKKKTEENPDTMLPLKFPHIPSGLLKKIPVSSNQKLTQKQLIKRAVMIGTFLSIAGLAYYLFVLNDFSQLFSFRLFPDHRDRSGTEEIQETPTPIQPINYGLELILYVETPDDPWLQTSQEELSLLSPGDIIKIAIKADIPPNEIEVTVNSGIVPLSVDKTPLGHLYARYVIPEGESEFHIAARAL